VTRLTPGQDADTTQLVGLVDQVRVARPGGRGRPRMRPDHLTGDKAYSSRANRAALRARRIRHTIPEREDQQANRARRGARGGRPPAVDRKRYRRRNQVERLMNRRKQFRAVATRFDKLAVRYQATIAVADIFIWLRARPDQPQHDPRNHALVVPDAGSQGSGVDPQDSTLMASLGCRSAVLASECGLLGPPPGSLGDGSTR
jgi:transposase